VDPVGQRLRQRRQDFGADLQDVARWSGLAPERLKAIEAGQSMTALEFELHCRGLAVSAGAFWAGDERDPRRGVTRFRSSLENGALSAQDLRLLSLAAEAGRLLSGVLKLLQRESFFAQNRAPVPIGSSREPWEQGYELAARARERLGPAPGPIRSVEEVLRDLGIQVCIVDFESKSIQGASLWEADAIPIILVNRRFRNQRAIMAHELCHLLHDGGEANLATRVSIREDTHEGDVEKRANAFAPAYLAPKSQVSSWWSELSERPRDPRTIVRKLAETWGLSFVGATWHAKNVGLIDAQTAHQLDPAPLEMTTDFEPQLSTSFPDELAERLKVSDLMQGWAGELISEAWRESAISRGRAQELLEWR
jgi:Zn-dependent peptidase ImmA (M78 family)